MPFLLRLCRRRIVRFCARLGARRRIVRRGILLGLRLREPPPNEANLSYINLKSLYAFNAADSSF